MATFRERLKQIREEMGISQNQMSKRLGISRVSLSYYETGCRTPDITFLMKLHQETGISLYYLLGLSDSRDDVWATTQRKTGLSEDALEYFASHPLDTKAINRAIELGTMQKMTEIMVILHKGCKKEDRP